MESKLNSNSNKIDVIKFNIFIKLLKDAIFKKKKLNRFTTFSGSKTFLREKVLKV